MSNIVHFPRRMTYDEAEIFRGRMRALDQYNAAKTDTERLRALIWVNHWRGLDQKVRALREIGLIA